MKRLSNFFTILTTLTISIFSNSYAQNLDHLKLIAHYPLSSDANDVTGNQAPMTLINTPFQDGGIYCNGNYINVDSDCNGYPVPDIAISCKSLGKHHRCHSLLYFCTQWIAGIPWSI